jgi:excisionase family DNA binding protein
LRKAFIQANAKRKKIEQAEVKEEIKQKPKAFVTEEEVKAMQAKEYLTLKEAALLLNVSPLTLRRWIFARKVTSIKVGKKHELKKTSLQLV